MIPKDRAARAALWQAYLHHGVGTFAATSRHPRIADLRHAVSIGWIWEPRAGAMAITPAGLEALSAFMPHRPDRVDEPMEAAR